MINRAFLQSAYLQLWDSFLKPGDHFAMVCTVCKSMTMREVADKKEVELLRHDGETMNCDSSDEKFPVKRTGPPSKEPASQKVTVVNAEGKEACSSCR